MCLEKRFCRGWICVGNTGKVLHKLCFEIGHDGRLLKLKIEKYDYIDFKRLNASGQETPSLS
jgi:hypothetical protein